ncbi:MAG TPA: hypothetical protein DDY79_11750 [Brevundimonas sp.]|nr:hypothetical protein [Brevundimonas sp.]
MNDDDFAAMKVRFIAAGDRLTDLQLLELADCYHEMLRQRRTGRRHQPSFGSSDRDRIAAEPRTF